MYNSESQLEGVCELFFFFNTASVAHGLTDRMLTFCQQRGVQSHWLQTKLDTSVQ